MKSSSGKYYMNLDQVRALAAFHFREHIRGRHLWAIAALVAFSAFYWWFDYLGGYYKVPRGRYPPSLWVILPTVEGLAYGIGIAWYDSSIVPSQGRLSRLIAQAGAYSYSIYLLHFFVVFRMSRAIARNFGPAIDLSNFYVAVLASVLCFACMIPVGYLSYRFIEEPFLRLRRSYLV